MPPPRLTPRQKQGSTAFVPQLVEASQILIPANGSHEWKRSGKTKQPSFEIENGSLVATSFLASRRTHSKGRSARVVHAIGQELWYRPNSALLLAGRGLESAGRREF
jgi:hypothetical protein